MRSRLLILLALGVALAACLMPGLGASGSRAEVAMLKKVASRVSDNAGVITIEASEPVPYVASQPDPRTFVVEPGPNLPEQRRIRAGAACAERRHDAQRHGRAQPEQHRVSIHG